MIPVFSFTPRFSGVWSGPCDWPNRFNGLAAGETAEAVGLLLLASATSLKRGVNEKGRGMIVSGV
jgi:hypothetical protein